MDKNIWRISALVDENWNWLIPGTIFFWGIKKVKLHKTKKKDRAIWYSRSKIKLGALQKKKLTFLDEMFENFLFSQRTVTFFCGMSKIKSTFFFKCYVTVKNEVTDEKWNWPREMFKNLLFFQRIAIFCLLV